MYEYNVVDILMCIICFHSTLFNRGIQQVNMSVETKKGKSN
jgi:hypothetical protein